MTRLDWLLMAFNVTLFLFLLRWLWIKRMNRLAEASNRPRCKHGVLRRGYICAECRKEDEAYFSEKPLIMTADTRYCVDPSCGYSQPADQPWFHGHDSVLVKWRSDHVTVNLPVEKEIRFDSRMDVPGDLKIAGKWMSFEAAFRLWSSECKFTDTEPAPMNPLCRQCKEKGSMCWYCRQARGLDPYGDIKKAAEVNRFKIGQWVRIDANIGGMHLLLGEIVSGPHIETMNQSAPPCCWLIETLDSASWGLSSYHERRLEPAYPLADEWWKWTHSNCPVCTEISLVNIIAPFKTLMDYKSWLAAVQNGCLAPVNFGKGNK
jgi:hypothetical protein